MSNALIFDTVRRWLDGQGFTPARITALDAACAAFLTTRDKATIFDTVRPWLDQSGFNGAGRVEALNEACDHFATVPSFDAVLAAVGDGMAAVGAVPAGAVAGDDRWLPLFRRMAAQGADQAVVQAMARTFAAHAPAFGQDASKPRIAEFVAQIANETGGFTTFSENLNYSAARIPQVWPGRIAREAAKRGISVAALCAQLDHNPEALANVIYARPEAGNTQPGDGWKYRGRGALQLTFRNNYRRFGELTGLPLEAEPDLASDPADSVLIALAFFKAGNVNAAIDAGNFRLARKITNGGDLGLASVATLRVKALQVLG